MANYKLFESNLGQALQNSYNNAHANVQNNFNFFNEVTNSFQEANQMSVDRELEIKDDSNFAGSWWQGLVSYGWQYAS